MNVGGHNGRARTVMPAQRRELIAERLRASGSVTVAELEIEFGVSAMTARRDLDTLEREGRAQRTHGGAVAASMARREDSFRMRLEQAAGAKERLAAAVASRIGDGEAVFIDSSTTAFVALRHAIASGRRLTVLTNSLPVMDLVTQTDSPQISLIGLSGSLRKVTWSFVGPQTIEAIDRHFADKVIFSVNGIGADGTLTEADPLEAEVKLAMVRRSREVFLLTDGSKFERAGLSAIAGSEALTAAFVADASAAQLARLRDRDVKVEVVK
jgi:DeoR/GlpR family transcriptional regulator of sugar metabolism